MTFTVLIPARLASTRLPNKPLADIHGLPMIVRVAQQAQQSGAAQVVVAADDDQIVQACQRHGVQVILTRKNHQTGSDRLGEACEILGLANDDLVVNVQGDEPLIAPSLIQACVTALQQDGECVMSTAAHPIHSHDEWCSPHVVKVVINQHQRALLFSRAPIPFWRDAPTPVSLPASPPLRHIGIYGYRAGFLKRFSQLPAADIERTESLEQLRVLYQGYHISVHVTPDRPGPGVDTPEDLERVRKLLASRAD